MKKYTYVMYGVPFKDSENEIEVKIWEGTSINRCRIYKRDFVNKISHKFKKVGMIEIESLKKDFYWVGDVDLRKFFK